MLKAASVTHKRQVTIPKSVRDALGLKEHDKVAFVVEGDKAIMRPIKAIPLEQLCGIAKGRAPFLGREVERGAARQHVVRHLALDGTRRE